MRTPERKKVNQMSLPNPLKETIKWARTNRPDLEEHFSQIDRQNQANDQHTVAIVGLMAMAFAAGRYFQRSHPDADLLGKDPYGE